MFQVRIHGRGGRFAHLFGSNPDLATIAAIQAAADRNIRHFSLAEHACFDQLLSA